MHACYSHCSCSWHALTGPAGVRVHAFMPYRCPAGTQASCAPRVPASRPLAAVPLVLSPWRPSSSLLSTSSGVCSCVGQLCWANTLTVTVWTLWTTAVICWHVSCEPNCHSASMCAQVLQLAQHNCQVRMELGEVGPVASYTKLAVGLVRRPRMNCFVGQGWCPWSKKQPCQWLFCLTKDTTFDSQRNSPVG